MPKLMAEEELAARSAAVHPFLEPSDQRKMIDRLTKVTGVVEAPRKPTREDIAGLGIKVQ